MSRKLHIETFGCQMNEYESDRTYRRLHDLEGYEWTDDASEADLVLFNTCSIRGKADQKALSMLGRFKEIKLARPEMVIAFGGCVAQSQGEEILERFPYVDIIFGTHQWNQLPEMVRQARDEKKKALELGFYGWQEYGFLPFKPSTLSHPVCDVVTVQNGCDKFCTFCVVPFTRGRQISRSPLEVLDEVKGIAEKGVKEITLLGQNVNAYGNDRSSETSFVDLLRRVSDVDGIERIRFMSSYPTELTREMVDEMAQNPKICEHIHFPLQCGSDRVLSKMNREHTLNQYREVQRYLVERIDNIAITTDLIVGFPSETEEEFQMTLDAMREFDFDDSFSFVYSPRPHTKAAKWEEDFIPKEVALDRLARLQTLQHELKTRKHSAYLGRCEEVLIEGKSKRGGGELYGKTRSYKTVNFAGPDSWIGTLKKVRIKEILNHTLRGEAVVD